MITNGLVFLTMFKFVSQIISPVQQFVLLAVRNFSQILHTRRLGGFSRRGLFMVALSAVCILVTKL